MGLFDLFGGRSEADKIRNQIRARFDDIVRDSLRDSGGDPFLGGMMVEGAIYSLYRALKETPGLGGVSQIIEEEKDRALRKYLR